MSLHIGEDIGDYRVVSIIGAGSMGQVFQVEHRITKRKEALKVLVGDCATESQIQRFEREIETQARLDHLHIARVHNALLLNGSQILVMELVEGESLEKKLRKGSVSAKTGIGFICQTLSALEHAHSHGVVHRDVTPGNLIIDQAGNVKLTDFGVAKSLGDYQLTSAGEIVGSLHYMPPEQVRRHSEPDPRSDIYSTGAVLYEVLTGKKLFDCADRLSLMVAQVQQQPTPPLELNPDIGPELNALVLKALAKDPSERYQSAKEFLEVLRPFAQEPVRQAATQPSAKRKIFALAPLGAVALAALAITFMAVLPKSATPSPAPLPPKAAVQTPPQVVPVPVLTSTPEVSEVSELKVPRVTPPVKHGHPMMTRSQSAEKSESAVQDEVSADEPKESEPTASAEETTAAPEEAAAEDATEPATAEQQQVAPAHHKGFWSKLNIFKRKKANPETQDSFTQR